MRVLYQLEDDISSHESIGGNGWKCHEVILEFTIGEWKCQLTRVVPAYLSQYLEISHSVWLVVLLEPDRYGYIFLWRLGQSWMRNLWLRESVAHITGVNRSNSMLINWSGHRLYMRLVECSLAVVVSQENKCWINSWSDCDHGYK